MRYTSLNELGISLDGIEFQPMPETVIASTPQAMHPGGSSAPMLTIAEAKKALATTFGVKPENVEITIRG